MAFVPIRGVPLEPPAEVGAERSQARPRGCGDGAIHPPAAARSALTWRAIVHAQGRDIVQVEWHLAACRAPHQASAHCAQGQHLLETLGDPDGHCLIDDHCPRCEE